MLFSSGNKLVDEARPLFWISVTVSASVNIDSRLGPSPRYRRRHTAFSSEMQYSKTNYQTLG